MNYSEYKLNIRCINYIITLYYLSIIITSMYVHAMASLMLDEEII